MNAELQAELIRAAAPVVFDAIRGLISSHTGRAPETIPPAEVRRLLAAVRIESARSIAAEGEAEGAARLAETDSTTSEEG